MVNVRKLAAIDLQFLGPKVIISEFGLGVFASAALGLLTIRAGIQRFHSPLMIIFGVYLLLLGFNYAPLLLHALTMTRDGTALHQIQDELGDRRKAFRKYRRQSLFLLLPLIVVMAAIVQEIQRRRGIRARR
jgi:hypothetical protein